MSDTYPRISGPHLLLGPEIFTGDGREVPQDVISWRGATYVLTDPGAPPRTWVGEASAAYDQGLTAAGDSPGFPEPAFWINRAAAAAAIASAEQQRIANLIAWKQLRQSATTSALPGGGDAVADEIETKLGLAVLTTASIVPAFTPEEVQLIVDGLEGIASGDAGSYPDETKQTAAALAVRLVGGTP